MPRIKIEDLPKDKQFSQKEMMLIQGGGGHSWRAIDFLRNPLTLAGIVAAAVAIPLAVTEDDDGS